MDSQEAATNKEASNSGGGDQKKAKASPSPPASHDHQDGDDDILPPPPPVTTLHLCSLPDIAHAAIASYLTMVDMHCMMESSLWLLEVYRGKVQELRLVHTTDNGHIPPTPTLLSIMSRRPNIMSLTVRGDILGVVVEAMRKGYLNKLQVVDIMTQSSGIVERDKVALCDALAHGVCPKINKLVVPSLSDLDSSLAAALRSRMEEGKGCCGIKSLEIQGFPSSLSLLLSSGACEALEELKIEAFSRSAEEELSEWLLRTKAPQVRALPNIALSTAITALCSPGVAPMLHVLDLYVNHASLISLLSQAIGGGAWPHLREVRIEIEKGKEMVPSLVEAIGVGATELVSLKFIIEAVMPDAATAVALARMVRDGGCPRLEELNLSRTSIRDDAVVELWRALEGGAPCSTTLRRLDISSCQIILASVRELMESMGRGALPHLGCLDISNNKYINDEGVVILAEAMAGGTFRSLQELNLYNVGTGRRGASALFQALRDHKPCPHLKKLSVGSNDIGDGGVVVLAEAIEAGALQHLQELQVSDTRIGEEGFKSLVKAIVSQHPNPGCPRLEVLDVSYNEQIGDNGVMYLVEAMKLKGAMQHLREIRLKGQNVGKEVVKALFESLGARHVCPNLSKLYLGIYDGRVHGRVDEVKQILQASRRQELRRRRVIVEWAGASIGW